MAFIDAFFTEVARPALFQNFPTSGYEGVANVSGVNIGWGWASDNVYMRLRLLTDTSFDPSQAQDIITVMTVLQEQNGFAKWGTNVMEIRGFTVVNDPFWKLW